MVDYHGTLIKRKIKGIYILRYSWLQPAQLSMIATSPLLCFPITWWCEVPVGQKGEELGKGIIIANAELWTGLYIRFAMHLVQIKLHNCRSNQIYTKLHDCGDIPLCRGVSPPKISMFVTGEEGGSAAKCIQISIICSGLLVVRGCSLFEISFASG